MKKTLLKYRIVILVCCICLPTFTYAQPDPPNDAAPIDGGLSLLLAAGAAYGVKKYRDSKKKPFDSAEDEGEK